MCQNRIHVLSQMPIDINKLLNKVGARVISFQPRLKLYASGLLSIIPGVGKVPVPFPSGLFFLVVCSNLLFSLVW